MRDILQRPFSHVHNVSSVNSCMTCVSMCTVPLPCFLLFALSVSSLCLSPFSLSPLSPCLCLLSLCVCVSVCLSPVSPSFYLFLFFSFLSFSVSLPISDLFVSSLSVLICLRFLCLPALPIFLDHLSLSMSMCVHTPSRLSLIHI